MNETTTDETIQQANARIEALEAEVAALKAQIAGHRQNYRVAARTLAGLVSGMLNASEAP